MRQAAPGIVYRQASWLVLSGGWLEYAWFVVILATSFGILGPGKPQPADFMMVPLLCLPIVLLRYHMPTVIRRPVLSLFAFVAYAFACNFAWAAVTSELDFFKASAFYAFNFSVFLGYLVMLGDRGDDWLRWTLYGFAASLVMLTLLSFPFSDRAESGRLELFFVNSNQLAYHVLLCTSIVAMLAPRYKLPRAVVLALLLCAIYLELRTYSRAGLLGVALLAVLQFVERPNLLIVAMLPFFGLALYWDLQALDTQLWEQRLQEVSGSTTDDYLTDRGLDRVLDHPEYLWAGAGEGYFLRFHHEKQEIHSSAANLIFSYGVIGTSLFLVFLRWLTMAAGTRLTVLMTPALVYSLFHHGMRARPFWLLLAIALGAGVMASIEAEKQSRTGAALSPPES